MSGELDNLVATGALERRAASETELLTHRAQGRAKLADAEILANSLEGRFTLAYSGIHALSMAALRAKGYRPKNARQVTFLTLAHTVTLPKAAIAVISWAHEKRNLMDYEGEARIDVKFVAELIAAGHQLEKLLPNP